MPLRKATWFQAPAFKYGVLPPAPFPLQESLLLMLMLDTILIKLALSRSQGEKNASVITD